MKTRQTEQPTIVCAAIIIHQQKVLLTLRPEGKRLGGYWEFPGGKLEPGEAPHAALQRELREEIDIQVDIERLLKKVRHQYEWGSVRIDGYLCRFSGGTIRHLEVADHAWVPFDQLDGYKILPADQPFVDWLQHHSEQERGDDQEGTNER